MTLEAVALALALFITLTAMTSTSTPVRDTARTIRLRAFALVLLSLFAFGDAFFNFFADPNQLGAARWSYGASWVVLGVLFTTFLTGGYQGLSRQKLAAVRVILIFGAYTLFSLGLRLSFVEIMVPAVIGIAAAAVLAGIVLIYRRHR